MKRRDLEKELKKLGYTKIRDGGNHEIWCDIDGTKTIAVPRHNEINEITARSILKSAKR